MPEELVSSPQSIAAVYSAAVALGSGSLKLAVGAGWPLWLRSTPLAGSSTAAGAAWLDAGGSPLWQAGSMSKAQAMSTVRMVAAASASIGERLVGAT